MVQISREYDSTFCLWKGYELFVFLQDIKHIAVSCLLHAQYYFIFFHLSILMTWRKYVVKIVTPQRTSINKDLCSIPQYLRVIMITHAPVHQDTWQHIHSLMELSPS
jgi:hypothetical protein